MATRDEMATSFGAAAGAYDEGRPDYPAEAVAWLLEPAGPRPRVADIGAGTGKLTKVVATLGADVIAVDPDAAMLARLRDVLPGVQTLIGAAETLILPDESLDAAVLGQAWHWVDPVAGSAEIGRVLRPGGVLGLIWNIRDESVPWVARLTAIMKGSHAEQLLAGDGPVVASPFGPLETRTWRWQRPGDAADPDGDGAFPELHHHGIRRRASAHRPRDRRAVRRGRRGRRPERSAAVCHARVPGAEAVVAAT